MIAPGTGTDILAGPLTGINALSSNRSQLHQLLYDLSKILGTELEPSASYERHIENIINIQIPQSVENNSLQGNPDLNQPVKEEDTVKLVIWKLDEQEYDQYGYSLEKIAEKSRISIPKCQHLLNSLIKKDYVELKKWFGGINGERYLLKDGGRNYLLQNNLVS